MWTTIRIRVTVADGTGKTSTEPASALATTTAHELYGHALKNAQGKPYEHDNGGPVDKSIKKIEDHTKQLNPQWGEQLTKVTCYLVGCILALAFFLTGNKAQGQEINFCSISLSPAILQAHASFSAIYEFDVAENGSPANIKPLEKKFTNATEVEACIQKWSLPQSASKHLVAVFEWQHGIGWVKLAVSGPDIKLSIHLSGDRCPYCAKAPGNLKSSGTR
jgi:hypothetical protein